MTRLLRSIAVLGAAALAGCGGEDRNAAIRTPPGDTQAHGRTTLPQRAVPGITSAEVPGTPTSRPMAESIDDMDLRELMRRSGQLAERFKRADWDVAAKAGELAGGVDPALAFVRDHIRYEPYAGVLRGAAGAYASRAGNATDRALLLAKLLEAKGIPIRFAIGTLGQEECERLFVRTFDQQAARAGAQERRLDEGARLHQRLFRRAREDYEAVRAALGTRLAPVTTPSRDDVVAEMNPHVWLQALVDGRWLDLDPSLAGAEPGRAIAVIDRTLEQLPDDQFQHVTIRVVAEHLMDGAVVSSTRLEVTRKAVDMIDTQILLFHERPMAASGIGSAIANAFGQSTGDHWIPVLWIAGELTFGTRVDAAAGSFVGEWLEFELAWPNGRREVRRRALVDRGGPAWRAAARRDGSPLRPVPQDENGALAMQAVHNVWLSAGGHPLADFADAVRMMFLDEAVRALAEHDSQNPDRPTEGDSTAGQSDEFAREVWPFVLQNFSSMILTDHVILPLLNNTPGVRLYADGPRISIFTTGSVGGGKIVNSVDLRRDDLRGVALDPSKAAVVADLKLRFGLLQGALEHESLADFTVAATGDSAGVWSTSSLLAGKRLAALAPGASVPAVTDDATAAIGASLAAGRVVVAAPGGRAGTHAWWEVVPETGETRAIADLGLHGAGTPPLDRNNPFVIKRKMQQNPYGGQKAWDARSESEIRREIYEARRANAERKAAAEAAEYRNGLAQPQQGQARGGGSEYAVLIVLGALGKIALSVLSYVVLEKSFEEIELLVSWLADGGYSAVWP